MEPLGLTIGGIKGVRYFFERGTVLFRDSRLRGNDIERASEARPSFHHSLFPVVDMGGGGIMDCGWEKSAELDI